MKNFLLFFLLLITVNIYSNTRHTLSGTISDVSTGESMIGASITVKELPGTGVTTNGYGYFSLTVPDGNYTFIISYLGYKTIVAELKMNANKLQNFKLEPDARQLDDVEITAVRKNNNITSSEIGMEKI